MSNLQAKSVLYYLFCKSLPPKAVKSAFEKLVYCGYKGILDRAFAYIPNNI